MKEKERFLNLLLNLKQDYPGSPDGLLATVIFLPTFSSVIGFNFSLFNNAWLSTLYCQLEVLINSIAVK